MSGEMARMPEPSEVCLIFASARLGEPALVDGSGLDAKVSRVYFDLRAVKHLEGPAVHGLMRCACSRETYVRVLPGTQPHESLTRLRTLSNRFDADGFQRFMPALLGKQVTLHGGYTHDPLAPPPRPGALL